VAEQLTRHVAPGGVRRLVIGFACGLAAGAVIALVLPRDDGPRRRTLDVASEAPGDGLTLEATGGGSNRPAGARDPERD
jgi:hypothetical protein